MVAEFQFDKHAGEVARRFRTKPNTGLEPTARIHWRGAAQSERQPLEDRSQERPVPTTIGGGATTVELAYQRVGDRSQSKSLKLAGLASDLADRFCCVASRLEMALRRRHAVTRLVNALLVEARRLAPAKFEEVERFDS